MSAPRTAPTLSPDRLSLLLNDDRLSVRPIHLQGRAVVVELDGPLDIEALRKRVHTEACKLSLGFSDGEPDRDLPLSVVHLERRAMGAMVVARIADGVPHTVQWSGPLCVHDPNRISRRIRPREHEPLTVTLILQDSGRELRALVRDLSSHGAGLQVPRFLLGPLYQGAHLKLRLPLIDGRPPLMVAAVVRHAQSLTMDMGGIAVPVGLVGVEFQPGCDPEGVQESLAPWLAAHAVPA